jgi:hypothetical protein
MDDAMVERYGALAGVGFVVFILLAGFVGGIPPIPTDSSQEITRYFRDNQDELQLAAYLNGLALVAFLWFLGTLFGRLRRSEGGTGRLAGIALTGGVVGASLATLGNALLAEATLRPGGAPEAWPQSAVILGYAAFGIAVLTLAASAVIARSGLMAPWVGWLGALVGIGWLVGGLAVATTNDAIGVVGLVAFLAWAAWILVVSLMLLTRSDAAPATSAP